MLKYISPVIISLFLMHFRATAQNWLWAKSFTGNAASTGNYLAAKPDGNIYCVGEYQASNGSERILTVVGGADTISSIGWLNGFVAEFDQAGNFITITNVPITSNCEPNPTLCGLNLYSPLLDDSGNIYIMSSITGPSLFDTINASPFTGLQTVLISKWVPDARCLWVKVVDSSDWSVILEPSFFYNNNIYFNGDYLGTANIDTIHLNDSSFNGGSYASYIGKLNTSGNCVWLKQATGGITAMGLIGNYGNRFSVLGGSDSCFLYDTLNVCGPVGIGVSCLFETDTNGAVLWSRTFRFSDAYQTIGGMVNPSDGCNYLLGYFDTTVYIGNDTLTKAEGGTAAIFLAKFDSSGNLLWTRQIPYNGSGVTLYDECVNSSGDYYVCGNFSGTAQFGDDTVTALSWSDLFITCFSPSGNCLGVVTVPTAFVASMILDSANNVIVTGSFDTTAVFGDFTLAGTATNNFFIAKLSAFPDSGTGLTLLPPIDTTLVIFANPNQGKFTIIVPQAAVNANSANLSIYDITGRLISNGPIDLSGNELQLNLGVVARGNYNVLLTANGMQFKGRVVIE